MQNDLTTGRNRAQESRVFELRNQFRNIPLMRVVNGVLQTNISAAC